jgi:hypothetical protein
VTVAKEEEFAAGLDADERRLRGVFFTPAPLVRLVLDLASPHLPAVPDSVIDPASGAGAFLNAAEARYPRAQLLGLELSPETATLCRSRVPRAKVLVGDALKSGWDQLLSALPASGYELWVGNPPFNGTSAILRDKGAFTRLQQLLPDGLALPRGTSLRDDYIFFLLQVASRLKDRPGLLAFITSATLLDSFLYARVRQLLLQQLELCEVVELGTGLFTGTRVRTCVTIWRTPSSRRRRPTQLRSLVPTKHAAANDSVVLELDSPQPLEPRAPEWILRKVDGEAERLHAEWSAVGEPLTTLFPIHFTGLKTRFDELLVDASPSRLLARVQDFLRCPSPQLSTFAEAHGLSPRLLPALLTLHRHSMGATADAGYIRPFARYAGARHRGTIPDSGWSYCYLDRRLIPRGDHRLQGAYDPHQCPTKLVFNVRELPLSAAFIDRPGCVHAHRHARFAPLWVPALILSKGRSPLRADAPDLGPEVPNLSERGRKLAEQRDGPRALFEAVTRFINSDLVQNVWAPSLGTTRILPVPLTKHGLKW